MSLSVIAALYFCGACGCEVSPENGDGGAGQVFALANPGFQSAQEALERESDVPCIDQISSDTVPTTGVATKVAAVAK